jgi:hypothetical protein
MGYLSVVKLLRAFNDFIRNNECGWWHGGVVFFYKIQY